MGAGNYRTRVTFQSMATTVDDYRQPTQTLSDLITTGANVELLSSSERERFGLQSTNQGVRVRVRGSTTIRTIDVGHVMNIRGTFYDIVGVDNEQLSDREFVFVGEVRR